MTHTMAVIAVRHYFIQLSCDDCDHKVELGSEPTVGAIVEAYADHQKTISKTEQEVTA